MFRASPFDYYGGYPYNPYQQFQNSPYQRRPQQRVYNDDDDEDDYFFSPFSQQRHPQYQEEFGNRFQPRQRQTRQQTKRTTPQQDAMAKKLHAEKLRQSRINQLLSQAQTRYAVKIQRWWREVQQRIENQRKQEAALVIQRFMKQLIPQVQKQRFLKALRSLHATEAKAVQLNATFADRLRGRAAGTSKDLLIFEDTMDKLIISLDGISIHGNDALRNERKRIVREAQAFLTEAQKLNTMASVVQRHWREHQQHRRNQLKPAAARTIMAAIRRIQARKQAKSVVQRIRDMDARKRKVDQLLSELQSNLTLLATETEGVSSEDSDRLAAAKADVLARISTIQAKLQ